jgi:hypothetical protein
MNAHAERIAMGALTFFIAVSAAAGAVGLIGGGLAFPPEWLEGTPFANHVGPGLILGLVLGGSALVATLLILSAHPWAVPAAFVAGFIQLGWIVGEVLLIGTYGAIMLWLQVLYGVAGALLAVLAYDVGRRAAGYARTPCDVACARSQCSRTGFTLMPLALVGLAAGLGTNVLLGPLGLGLLQWRVSPNALNQTYGADAVSLLLVVPAALAAAWLWRAGYRLAAPVAFGAGLATLYYAIAEVLGPDYLRYAGNNERFSLLFLALIILSWTTAARAWVSLDPQPPQLSRRLGRGLGTVLLLAAGVIGSAWLAQLLDLAVTGTLSAPADALAYADSPSAFWTIRVVDLGFLLPISLWTGVGLWRGSSSATRATFGVASFLTLQAASVLAMGAAMLWRQDPTANPVLIVVLTPITLALVALTARLLATYATLGRPVTTQPRETLVTTAG